MAGSTCEAEYMAALEAAQEAVWVKEFMTDLGVIPNASGPMTLFCDKRRFNSIRGSVQNGSVQERVLACTARCEIELGSMPDHGKR